VLAVGADAREGIERFRSLRLVEAFLDEFAVVLPAVDLCGWMMTNRRGARATGDGLPERTKLAAVLAAVKVRPGSVSGEGSVGRAGRP
jgi:hypothetical protein